MRRLLFAIAMFCAACTTQKTVHLPSGQQGHSITCHGAVQDWADCFNKAGEICQARGYEIIGRSDQQGAIVSGGRNNVFGSSTFYRTLMIACK